MKVIFVSRDIESLRLISGEILKKHDEHLFFSCLMDFMHDFDSLSHDTDLFIFDYNMIHSCKILFFNLLKNNARKIPLIFYNDPFASGENRVLYWVRRNENFFGTNSFDYLIPFLLSLNDCIDKLMIRSSLHMRECENDKTEDELPNKELPPALSKLFLYFRQNCGKEVSVSELCRIDKDFASENTVYSYISRLRKYILHDKRFKIIRTGKSRYKLFELG